MKGRCGVVSPASDLHLRNYLELIVKLSIRSPMVFRSFHADKPCGIVSAEQSNRRSAQPRGESSRTAAITENDAGQTTDGCEVCGEISRRRTALRTRSHQEVVRDVTTRTRGTSLTMFSFPRRVWERTTGRSASPQGLRSATCITFTTQSVRRVAPTKSVE
jgi:hypothetical protein